MDKQTWVHPINGLLVSNRKESPDTCNNLEESQRHYVKWKKPISKGYILYDSISDIIKKDKTTVRGRRLVVARGQEWRRDYKGSTWGLLGMMELTVLYCSDYVLCWIHEDFLDRILKTTKCKGKWLIHLTWTKSKFSAH